MKILTPLIIITLNIPLLAQAQPSAQLKNKIIKTLERSTVSRHIGTKYEFEGCNLIIDSSNSTYGQGGCDFSGTKFKKIDKYDMSKVIASSYPQYGNIRLKCDGDLNCRTLSTFSYSSCKQLGKPYSIKFNGGGIDVASPSDSRRLEDLFYELREQCE